jgi:hypothetical protein
VLTWNSSGCVGSTSCALFRITCLPPLVDFLEFSIAVGWGLVGQKEEVRLWDLIVSPSLIRGDIKLSSSEVQFTIWTRFSRGPIEIELLGLDSNRLLAQFMRSVELSISSLFSAAAKSCSSYWPLLSVNEATSSLSSICQCSISEIQTPHAGNTSSSSEELVKAWSYEIQGCFVALEILSSSKPRTTPSWAYGPGFWKLILWLGMPTLGSRPVLVCMKLARF